ncbi:STAM-binding protein-like A isoform X2 [Culicoides brevitarsis]
MELIRMANIYMAENNLENAYILYMKFMVLFLEKIQSHPEYKTTSPTLKQPNQAKLKEILPITEKLKDRLKDRYQKEYTQFLARKIEDETNMVKKSEKTNVVSSMESISKDDLELKPVLDKPLLQNVVYPNDFAVDTKSGSTNLLLPIKPIINRSLKPSTSLIEGSLRKIVVPSKLMQSFLLLAKLNTSQNIETCGILAGKLASNKFTISHVILPKQVGSSETCVTENEEEIFSFQDKYNLITLGWIHTHPTQTAFLSSVDLHTHFAYQKMIPESIAIVCAPKYNTTGFFCLTPEHGLEYIAQCRQTGFHPHPSDLPLFTQANHIQQDENAKLEIIDLRI